ncbi:ABC transporter ATP-binding protein, partial [Actinotignum schaalii]|uniref:ABC transporter ATP-binding protein n=1 Tax=Actinotignum TaxID=1653174 RepID=UPI00040559E4|nr:ABC transporter ATP-binding protein [Actinotignum schaalii]WQN45164.1 ABC transporter ATP-binding protein [Actinotignum schaalii]
MDTPILEAIGVEKIYPKKSTPALTGVNLALHPGELVAVIGHNGAGKSTLFDILGGLIKPTRGTVTNSVAESAIGWCPQREIIDWSLTVTQNILLGLDLRVGRWHRRADIEGVAEVLGLSQLLDRTAETLSGGELRRTQIARAIIGNPTLMILDEPTTGLDPAGIDTVFSYLRSRVTEGRTVLVSTHETSKFSEYCTRVIALRGGRIIADMPAAQFMAYRPGSTDLWAALKAYEEGTPLP